VLEQWTEQVLGTYPQDTAAFLRKQKDRFANPVGSATMAGLEAILDALIAGDDLEAATRPLQDIVRIRAVQEFSPSAAVGFVLLLKKTVEDALGKSDLGADLATELRPFRERVDALALIAFDFYSKCRQDIYELRLTELRNQVVDVREKVLARQGKWDKLAKLQAKKEAAGEPVTLPVLGATARVKSAGHDGPASSSEVEGAERHEPGNNQPVE